MGAAEHESYFAQVEDLKVRARLEQIQAIVEKRVPLAQRCTSYGMPAYRMGKVFIYFAAFKKHIGIYPPVTEPDSLVKELGPYRGPKGNLIFPHSEPLRAALIASVVDALVHQYADRNES